MEKTTYPVSKHGQYKLSRKESFQNPLDDSQIGSQGYVAFKADVREFRLRSDVDRHVLALES